jgi:hypothetical protein
MKFNIFILLTLSIAIIAVNAKSSKRHSLKNLNHLAAKNTTNSTGPLVLNSIGRKVYVKNASSIILTKFPFEITRCDQVVTFNGSFIPNLNEYRARAEGWFTLTAHYANLFADNNANKLLRSILLSETSIAPRIFHGSGGCIMIYSKGGGDHNISVCLDDKKQQQNILEVLKTFTDCRGGTSLKKLDPLKIANMIKTCGGKGKFVNPSHLMLKLLKKKQSLTTVRKDENWFHPGSDNVPGTGKRR